MATVIRVQECAGAKRTMSLYDDKEVATLLREKIQAMGGNKRFIELTGIKQGDINYALNKDIYAEGNRTRFIGKMLDLLGLERTKGYRKR